MDHSIDSAIRQVQRLKNQIGWVTRIATALSSTQSLEDIYSIVLAGILSPTGLGFSHAMLFEYDEQKRIIKGKCALSHDSREAIDELDRELRQEDEFLERRRTELESRILDESDATEAELTALQSGGQWVTIFQRLNPDNPETRQLEQLTFSTVPVNGTRFSTIFEEAPFWQRSRAFSRSELGKRLPAEIAEFLPEHFAATPLVTKRGLRALIIVDRRLDGHARLSQDELHELDWFARQSAVAIENAELFRELNTAYQELKQVETLKSNFLSTISHELRTPLTSMIGFVELVLEEKVGQINENQRTLLKRVARNTAHLSRLVNDLIEIAELESDGVIKVSLRPVEPLTVYLATVQKLENRRRQQNVRIEPVVDGEIPRINCDDRALERIYFHLLDNALKFSPENSTIRVRFQRINDEVHISFIDEGTGIPQEKLRRIFDYFYQIDNALTRMHEGLGLGLSVTKMLVQATRGQILVESEFGKGSCFTLIYPLAPEGGAVIKDEVEQLPWE